MTKIILYLDQNHISELAKSRSLPGWENDDKSFYEELFQLLRKAIELGLLVCPTSPLHTEESELSEKFKGFIW